MRRSRRPRTSPSQPCPETPLSCASPTSPAGRAPLLRRRDLLMLRPHDHHLDRRRAEADLTIETDQGLGVTIPARSGGRPSRLVLPQLPTAVRAPLGAPRMSGIRAVGRRGGARGDAFDCAAQWGAPGMIVGGVGCALLRCDRSADARLERYRLPAMFVGHAGPCSMDPCHCSVLLAWSRGRGAPPGTHVPPSGACEVVRNEYKCSLD